MDQISNKASARVEPESWDMDRAETLRNLREILRKKSADHREDSSHLKVPTGIEGVDRMLLGGFRRGGLTMITGDWAAGKTSLALSPLIRVSKERHLTAIVDVAGCLFPPVIARMGADLERVLLVRSKPRKAVWATEQILRSGIFHVVLLIDSVLSRDRNGLKLSGAMLRKLQLASEVANALMLVVHSRRVESVGSSLCIKVEASPFKEQPDEAGFTATSRLAQVSVLRGARAGSALVEL